LALHGSEPVPPANHALHTAVPTNSQLSPSAVDPLEAHNPGERRAVRTPQHRERGPNRSAQSKKARFCADRHHVAHRCAYPPGLAEYDSHPACLALPPSRSPTKR
jgi:hypothetical protein